MKWELTYAKSESARTPAKNNGRGHKAGPLSADNTNNGSAFGASTALSPPTNNRSDNICMVSVEPTKQTNKPNDILSHARSPSVAAVRPEEKKRAEEGGTKIGLVGGKIIDGNILHPCRTGPPRGDINVVVSVVVVFVHDEAPQRPPQQQ
jgi:hypothetical protein